MLLEVIASQISVVFETQCTLLICMMVSCVCCVYSAATAVRRYEQGKLRQYQRKFSADFSQVA